MTDFFARFGALVDERWRARAYDDEAFADVAAGVLAELPPSEHVGAKSVVSWLAEASTIPSQFVPGAGFGDLPLTVFECSRFHVDVLFWVDGTTSIHQHEFDGAFHVLAGSSLHCTFAWREARRFGNRLRTGALTMRGHELLPRGATRAIRAGDSFIHSLFHLDRPSLSVVVRTRRAPSCPIQLSYVRPGLAFDPFHSTPAAAKQLQMLAMLRSLSDASFPDVATRIVSAADPALAHYLLAGIFSITGGDASVDTIAERGLSPELAEVVLPTFAERRRELDLVRRRALVTDRDHRFLLALLLNVRGRAGCLSLVRAYAGREPGETILGWLRELSASGALGPRLDDAALAVVGRILSGPSGEGDEGVLTHLRAEYGAEQVDNQRESLLALCGALRASPALSFLLSE